MILCYSWKLDEKLVFYSSELGCCVLSESDEWRTRVVWWQGSDDAQVHTASVDQTGLQLTIDDIGPEQIDFKLP